MLSKLSGSFDNLRCRLSLPPKWLTAALIGAVFTAGVLFAATFVAVKLLDASGLA